MGRTASSWAKIGLFYLIFYGFLAGFFSGMLAIFMTTVDEPGKGGPKLTQFIENKAGLNRLDRSNLLKSYSTSDDKLINNYVDLVKTSLSKFDTSDHSGKICGTQAALEEKKPCVYNVSLLGDCDPAKDPNLGLPDSKPCIFVRINRVFGWVPEDDGSGFLRLACSGPAEVFPEGFQIAAFPFKGQAGYQAPVVAVKVAASSKNTRVDCKLQGKNIEVSDSFNPSRSFGNIRIDITAT